MGKIIAYVIVYIALLCLIVYIGMTLWNNLIPELFNGPTITYKQMFGLWGLCLILFSHPKASEKE